MHVFLRRAVLIQAVIVLAACDGRQSALAPAGDDAAAISQVFWVMLAGAILLFLAMNGLFFYFHRIGQRPYPAEWARWIVIGGGILLPTLTVGSLLVWGLSILPDQRQPGDGLKIHVTGEEWWWRVEYWPEGASQPVVSANEIRFPAGERTDLVLTSNRYIHSLWIPALGGKLDMFPGRETRMSLRPTKDGRYRGQCAEFCGESHAWMAFEAVVLPSGDFDAWLRSEAGDAAPPATPEAERGAALFRREGCGACHTVRGTPAVGQVGPDLTHVGGRLSVGAGRLGTGTEDFAAWIAHVDKLKPGALMPAYDHLTDGERTDLATYLKELR